MPPEVAFFFLSVGATERSRTADLIITSELLYQLSYGGYKIDLKNLLNFIFNINFTSYDNFDDHFELFL